MNLYLNNRNHLNNTKESIRLVKKCIINHFTLIKMKFNHNEFVQEIHILTQFHCEIFRFLKKI